jgi:hypothetical protein
LMSRRNGLYSVSENEVTHYALHQFFSIIKAAGI